MTSRAGTRAGVRLETAREIETARLGGRRFWYGVAAGGLCAFIWGVQAVVARRSVLDGLTTADVTVLRFLVAGTVLLPLCVRRRPFPVGELGWRRALALATLAGAPYSLVVVGGVAFAPALHSSVVTFGMIPVVATALTYPVLGEPPRASKLACLGLIVIGLVVFGWSGLRMVQTSAWRGYLLFVVAAAMWAAFSTLSKRWHVDAIGATATIAVLSLVSVPVWTTLLPMHLSGSPWGPIALQAGYMGMIVGVVSMYLYMLAVTLLGSVRASIFVALVPIVTAFVSAVLLAEHPTMPEVVGMIVVVAGVVLSIRS